MLLATLDIALRAGTVALLLVLAASLLRDFRNLVAGQLAIAFAVGSAAHAVTYTIGSTSPVSIWHAPLIALSTGNVVIFWLFTRALFDDAFALRWWHGWSGRQLLFSVSSIACGLHWRRREICGFPWSRSICLRSAL
jgi:hypothetical protein